MGSPDNIKRVLALSDAVDISEGRVAYYRYREMLSGLATYYGYPLEAVVAAFAALSPNQSYRGNLRALVSVIAGHKAGLPPKRINAGTYYHCRDRAYYFLSGEGEFLAVTTGEKTRNFYSNILNPLDPEPVTIDGHAVNVWEGRRLPLREVAEERFNYTLVASDYRKVAGRVGLLPSQLQAITWFTWKRINRILYHGRQHDLFRDVTGDYWRTMRPLEEIKPFETTAQTLQAKGLRNGASKQGLLF